MCEDLITIAMPVYNGMPYLRDAIDDILSQDYRNLEILISDNNSTDGSYELCKEYAILDSRIKLSRNQSNIGGYANSKKLMDIAQGKYFMFVAHDDRHASTFITTLYNLLNENIHAVGSFCNVKFITADGSECHVNINKMNTKNMTIQQRVKQVISEFGWYILYGLFHTDAIKSLTTCSDGFASDVVMDLELSLIGEFVLTDECLFHYRIINKPYTETDWFSAVVKMFRVIDYRYIDLEFRKELKMVLLENLNNDIYYDIIHRKNVISNNRLDLFNLIEFAK